jgi:adenylyltransferase/sulfurtransferase
MLHFSEEQVQRYSRHIILPEVGVDGQEKLLSSRVLIAGMGGLGSPAALYLAAAGIGTFGLVDFDVVELSNLQRQVIHTTEDLGKPKVKSAEETIKAINPDATVHQYRQRIASETIADIITDYDLVLDGTDNFPTRFLLNDACLLTGKILVYGAVLRFDGQVSVFAPNQGPCYRCFIPEMPPPGAVPSCQQGGILGVLPGVIGILQATEAIKLLIGLGEPLIGRLLLFDALSMEINEVKLRRDPDCPACGERSNLNELRDYEDLCSLAV